MYDARQVTQVNAIFLFFIFFSLVNYLHEALFAIFTLFLILKKNHPTILFFSIYFLQREGEKNTPPFHRNLDNFEVINLSSFQEIHVLSIHG